MMLMIKNVVCKYGVGQRQNMKVAANKIILSISLLVFLFINTGCQSMLPSETKHSQIKWQTYHDAQVEFDKIIPNQTTLEQLKSMGYNLTNTPNIKVLTYLDVVNIFMPNASITLDEVHPEVKKCIQAKDKCHAYELNIDVISKQRFGNPVSDIFGFRKNTKITGWKFRALILMRDDVVVYKLCSGDPSINTTEKKKNPLGPFQELDNLLGSTVKSVTKF